MSLLLTFFATNPIFPFPSVFLGSLPVCTSFRCVNSAEVHGHKEVRILAKYLYLHLLSVSLKTSMPGNPPDCNIPRVTTKPESPESSI